MILELEITAHGAQGDGIADSEGAPIYVPFALPGERVVAEVAGNRGSLREILRPSPARAEPACTHFGQCGGCALQHMAPADYQAFKRDNLLRAMGHRGFGELPLAPMVTSPPQSRRRIALRAMRIGKRVILGFSARMSHRIVPVAECPVARPEFLRLLSPIRDFLGPILPQRRAVDCLLTATETGVDLQFRGLSAPDLALRERLAEFAAAADLARISFDDEVILERRSPIMTFAGVPVALPPGAFLQATEAGERALQQEVAEHLVGAARVLDLFAGLGTFTFPLAATGAAVHAVEGDPVLVRALAQAAERQRLVKVTAKARDLFRNPLRPDELKTHDAVVIDPPRAGAEAQAAMLAASAIGRVAMVSCNPATFARDARILVDGGYELVTLRPVDQFLWSPHLELVGLFVRP